MGPTPTPGVPATSGPPTPLPTALGIPEKLLRSHTKFLRPRVTGPRVRGLKAAWSAAAGASDWEKQRSAEAANDSTDHRPGPYGLCLSTPPPGPACPPEPSAVEPGLVFRGNQGPTSPPWLGGNRRQPRRGRWSIKAVVIKVARASVRARPSLAAASPARPEPAFGTPQPPRRQTPPLHPRPPSGVGVKGEQGGIEDDEEHVARGERPTQASQWSTLARLSTSVRHPRRVGKTRTPSKPTPIRPSSLVLAHPSTKRARPEAD